MPPLIKRLEDRIYNHLATRGEAVPSAELAREFMSLAGGSTAADQVLDAVLRQDPRFQRFAGGWTARRAAPAWQPLADLPWFVLVADNKAVGNHVIRLLAVHEFHSGAESSPRLAMLMVGPDAATQIVGEEIRQVIDTQPVHVPVIKALRYLDELCRRPGIFLRGFRRQDLAWFLHEAENTGTPLPESCFSAADLLRLLQPGSGPGKLEDLLIYGNVSIRRDSAFLTEVDAWSQCLPLLQQELLLTGIERLDELQAAITHLRKPFTFSDCAFNARDLEKVPAVPGVYFLKNSGDEIIYIGKSVNLNRRLNSYFRWQEECDPKLQRIQAETRRFSLIRCGSDLEALLEESRFIEKHQPAINIHLEIHEPPAEKNLADPLLVLLPHADAQIINLFILEPAGRIYCLPISRTAPDTVLLDKTLDRIAADTKLLPSEILAYPPRLAPLALRWLRKNSQQLTFFKLHDYPDRTALRHAILDGIRHFDNNEKNVFV